MLEGILGSAAQSVFALIFMALPLCGVVTGIIQYLLAAKVKDRVIRLTLCLLFPILEGMLAWTCWVKARADSHAFLISEWSIYGFFVGIAVLGTLIGWLLGYLDRTKDL